VSEDNREDHTILGAIGDLERGADPAAAGTPRGDETEETLMRLYTEVLGLIPSELEPVAPSPGARERLLTAIGAVPAAPGAEGTAPKAERQTGSRPVPVPMPAPVTSETPPAPVPVSDTSRPVPRPAPAPRPRRPSRWPLALAATLALAFAGLSAWLWQASQEQRAEIADLRQQIEAQSQISEQAVRERQQANAEMDKMRDQFTLVTSPAVAVRPMQAVGDQPDARGMLFVAPDHQHWYLSLEGLQPAPAESVYKLWWVTAQGPLDAGSIVAEAGQRIRMGSDAMPADIRDVVITLEPAGSGPEPSGPPVLKATL
jgi:cell division protein FtsB